MILSKRGNSTQKKQLETMLNEWNGTENDVESAKKMHIIYSKPETAIYILYIQRVNERHAKWQRCTTLKWTLTIIFVHILGKVNHKSHKASEANKMKIRKGSLLYAHIF